MDTAEQISTPEPDPGGDSPAVQTRRQFSLATLFLVTVIVAMLAWTIAAVDGKDRAVAAGVIIFVMDTAFLGLATRPRGKARCLIVPFVSVPMCILPSTVFSSPVVLLNSLLLLILGVTCVVSFPQPLHRLIKLTALLSATAMCTAAGIGIWQVARLRELRAELHFLSLGSRLAYEKRQAATLPRPPLSSEARGALNLMETQLSNKSQLGRAYALELLHNASRDQFIRNEGFGIRRMARVNYNRLLVPPLRSITVDTIDSERDISSQLPWFGARLLAYRWHLSDDWELPDDYHRYARLDFLDPDGFGFARTPGSDEVSGFIEHAFHTSPASMAQRSGWTVLRLQLVSLLKFGEPRVYELDHLPRMDHLSSENVPTRPLDAFETAALAKLWTEEDVVVEEDAPGHFRMLGSLRAGTSCLECHSVPDGELLGAFTYELRHDPRPSQEETGTTQ